MAVGLVVGVLTLGLAAYGGSRTFGTRKAFALGTLALGFTVLGWSGPILAGRGMEEFLQRVEGGIDWTEADSRRAMARTVGFGTGMMARVAVIDVAF